MFLNADVCVYPAGLTQLSPKDACLVAMGIQGYGGTSLTSSDGRTIGILGVLGETPFEDEVRVRVMLGLFAVRTRAELERLNGGCSSSAALAQRGEVLREEWPLLRKPYTPRELSARVREVLDRTPV